MNFRILVPIFLIVMFQAAFLRGQDLSLTTSPSTTDPCATDITISGTTYNGCTVTGYSWAPSAGLSCTNCCCPVASPSVATTYTVTISSATCGPVFATVTIYPGTISSGTISGPTTVCAGSTISLTETYSVGSWSSSATGIATVDASTGVVTGVSAGSVTISYTISGSCGTATATYGITVTDVPSSVSASAAPNPICTGGTLTLTGSATGATSYSWSGPNGYSSTDLNPAAFTVSTLSAGIYTLTATNSCGSTVAYTSAVVVDVNPVGGTISGTTPVCRNVPTSLTTTGTPGGTWTSGSTTYATVNSSTGGVTGANIGAGNPGPHVVTITYTITNACGTASSTFNIKIKGIPTVTGGPWGCTYPDVHTVYGNPSSATYGSGSWTCTACSSVTTGYGTPSYSTGTITATATGGTGMATYTYTYTNPSDANYCSGSASLAVGIVAFPTLTVTGANVVSTSGTTTCSPLTTVLHASGGSALGYTWAGSSGVTSEACTGGCGNLTVTAVSVGTQVYTVTNYGSYCTVPATKTYTVTVNACKPGRENEEVLSDAEDNILIMPNPSYGIFTLTLPAGVASAAVTITDVAGKIVHAKITSSDKTDFDMGGFPAGMYLITVVSEDKKYHAKVMKE